MDEYFSKIISSEQKDVTVLMLIIDYVIKLDDSLKASSDLELYRLETHAFITPAAIIKGFNPAETKEVLHS
jgi:hypothetical protein